MWNFLGWDNATTYAGEVRRPVRSYVLSIGVAFFLILGIYLLTALSVHWSGIDPATLELEDHGFPVLGTLVGGRWLGILVAVGGMASAVGPLLRCPSVRFPSAPGHGRRSTVAKVVLCASPAFSDPVRLYPCVLRIVSILVLFTFSDLVVMDIILYGAGLFPGFLALVHPPRSRTPTTAAV